MPAVPRIFRITFIAAMMSTLVLRLSCETMMLWRSKRMAALGNALGRKHAAMANIYGVVRNPLLSKTKVLVPEPPFSAEIVRSFQRKLTPAGLLTCTTSSRLAFTLVVAGAIRFSRATSSPSAVTEIQQFSEARMATRNGAVNSGFLTADEGAAECDMDSVGETACSVELFPAALFPAIFGVAFASLVELGDGFELTGVELGDAFVVMAAVSLGGAGWGWRPHRSAATTTTPNPTIASGIFH